jgi:Amt family ammonium transporter
MNTFQKLSASICATIFASFTLSSSALAADGIDSGDTAWILTASALVLFMSLPGLALFYGGLVRAKNYLSVLMKVFSIACLASLVWIFIGYSIAFGAGSGSMAGYFGGFDNILLTGMARDAVSGTMPESVFVVFQMTFAVITPALIVGAFVERVKFFPVLVFTALWLILVYAPVVHWIWSDTGWLFGKVQDFAGGLVVHATAGITALVFVFFLGSRKGFPKDIPMPHRPAHVFIGASMLWVGWYGFNGGSALAADGAAGMAILVTHISASTAALTWVVIERIMYKRPTLVGGVTGLIAGLASITPAAGVVGPIGGMVIGLIGGLVCYGAVHVIRVKLKIDDSLDVFAVHGVGGILGILLLPFLAGTTIGGTGFDHSAGTQFGYQLTGTIAVVAWSAIVSAVLLNIIKKTMGLRVDEAEEMQGIDTALHGESAYN